jgi:hypothetical protein
MEMITEEEMRKIYTEAKNDKSLISKIDTRELLMAYENQSNDYLDGKTTADIAHEIASSFDLLEDTYTMSKKLKREMAESLTGYRFVDELDQLHVGKYTRWIQKYSSSAKPALTNGGFLTNLESGNEGTFMKIRLYSNKVINISFDNCLIYQRLNTGEQLVLLVADYAVK